MSTLRFAPELGWTFAMPDGTRCVLRDPDGPPTSKQLLRLVHAGLLEIRAEPGPKVSKLDCAVAIDSVREGEPPGGGPAVVSDPPEDPSASHFPIYVGQRALPGMATAGREIELAAGDRPSFATRRCHPPPLDSDA